MKHASAGTLFRQGWFVFAGLGVLTLGEYWVATSMTGILPYLAIIALIKAGLVVQYFMHVAQLWNTEEGE